MFFINRGGIVMIGDTDVSEMCVAMKTSPTTSWNHPGLGIWGRCVSF